MKTHIPARCLAEGCPKNAQVIVAQFPWLLCNKCAKHRKNSVMCRIPKEQQNYGTV